MKFREFILLFFLSVCSYGQDYTPMLELNKTWNMYLHYDFGGGLNFDIEATEVVEINGQSYFHLVASHNGCDTFLREDVEERKVYGLFEGEEYLHYDFSKEVGDSLWLLGEMMEITTIGYGDFYGMSNLKYFELEDGYLTLVEGIGFDIYGNQNAFELGCLYTPVYEWVELVNMNQPLSIDGINKNELYFFPNPAISRININSSSPLTKVWIFNALGQLMMHQEMNNGVNSLGLTGLADGTYFLKWETNEATGTEKIIKISK